MFIWERRRQLERPMQRNKAGQIFVYKFAYKPNTLMLDVIFTVSLNRVQTETSFSAQITFLRGIIQLFPSIIV